LRNVLAVCLLTTLTVMSVLSATSFVVAVHAQEQYSISISTDKLVYNVGENVTICVSPAPSNFPAEQDGLLVTRWVWIVVTKPGQSQVSPALALPSHETPECRATATLVADIAGQYRLDLWYELYATPQTGFVSPNATREVLVPPQLIATCYFQADGTGGKKMNFENGYYVSGCNCTPSACHYTHACCPTCIAGVVYDADDRSPVAGAVISIQANVTLTSGEGGQYEIPYSKAAITYTNATATAYTNATGQFRFVLPVPFSPNSTVFCTGTEWFPHYIITLVANKAGYEPARATIYHPPIVAPDLSMEASASKLIIAQGRSSLVTVTIHDYFWAWRNQSLLGLAAINLPEGVTVQFSRPSLPGREWSTFIATVYVSYNAPVGDHTIAIQTVPGEGHRICIQLIITSVAPMWVIAPVCVGAVIIVLVAIAVILRSRGRPD
jgi:hypothetical protein